MERPVILKGLSGCTLAIDGDKITKSANTAYSARLRKQYEKQVYFRTLELPTLTTPRAYEPKYEGDFSFTMDYIKGKNCLEYFEIIPVDKVLKLAATFDEYFDQMIKLSKEFSQSVLTDIIYEKLTTMKSKHKEVIDGLMQELAAKDLEVPMSFCHGDMTLSNMIFYKDKIYLIDFLDSYLNSFVMDLVKLKQDLFYDWTARIHKKNTLRFALVSRLLWQHLAKRYKKYIDTKTFKILNTINFLRIEPYAKNPIEKKVLEDILWRL